MRKFNGGFPSCMFQGKVQCCAASFLSNNKNDTYQINIFVDKGQWRRPIFKQTFKIQSSVPHGSQNEKSTIRQVNHASTYLKDILDSVFKSEKKRNLVGCYMATWMFLSIYFSKNASVFTDASFFFLCWLNTILSHG